MSVHKTSVTLHCMMEYANRTCIKIYDTRSNSQPYNVCMFKHNTGMQIFIVIAQIVLLLLLPQFVNKCEKLVCTMAGL